MRYRRVWFALAMVVTAAALQGALFGEGKIQPFGASPSLIVIVVIATVRYVDPEPGLLIGFTAGLLTDLLGGSALGLWAMAMTVVAYLTIRVRHRAEDGILVTSVGIFGIAFVANVIFAVVGQLFGEGTLEDPDVLHLMLLPAVYTTILAAGIFPLATLALRERRTRGWAT